ncbi:MAG TPA: DNA polymerase III subunit gamma/tau, partial [Sporosarcina sp.]|nr:DNA polymerase III subunit gamma/tau [Sporosarcina sp.]
TSAAKIFAKTINCEQAPVAEPCNECPTCLSITEGSNTDVIEFDAASNSRVEEMRDIIEKVRFAPSNARFKVYIIDEVHMLSNSAFNALLKTLEEPPAHVVFILATTEPYKLPLTIISRCQRFDFKPHTISDIIARLRKVLDDSGIKSDEGSLKIIAQAASGGMRDALSILEQVVSFSGDELTVEDALLVTGAIGEDIFYQLAEALLGKDAGTALSLLDQLIAEGKDVSRLAEDMITFFRDLLLLRTAPALKDLLELVTGDERFEEMAKQFNPDVLYSYIDILSKTQQEMRFSNYAKVYLESALLKMVNAAQDLSTGTAAQSGDLVEKVQNLERMIAELQRKLAEGVPVAAVPADTAQPRKPASRPTSSYKIPVGKINEVLKEATKQDIMTIREQWANMMQTMQKSHAALLEETEPVAASERAFVLKFKYEIHCGMASDNPSLQSSLTQALLSRTGKAYDVLFVPEEGWLKVREDFIRNSGLAKQSDQQAEDEQTADEMPSFMEEAEASTSDPLVSEAEKLFGKEFVEVYDD